MIVFWYCITSILFGVILFFPVRKFILVLNINRQQSRLKREITAEEHEVLKRKVAIIAAIISITFAFIYNKILMLKFF